jgi:hypothetical protein
VHFGTLDRIVISDTIFPLLKQGEQNSLKLENNGYQWLLAFASAVSLLAFTGGCSGVDKTR